MKIQSLALAIVAAFAFTACTEEAPAPTPTPAPTAPVAAPVEPAPAPAPTEASAPVADAAAAPVVDAAATSVFAAAPSCDAYIKEYTACFESSKMVSPEALAAAKQGLESSRQAWEMMAKDPAQAAALESSCKAVLDSMPQTKAAMGC
jgi:hypothetical protein